MSKIICMGCGKVEDEGGFIAYVDNLEINACSNCGLGRLYEVAEMQREKRDDPIDDVMGPTSIAIENVRKAWKEFAVLVAIEICGAILTTCLWSKKLGQWIQRRIK